MGRWRRIAVCASCLTVAAAEAPLRAAERFKCFGNRLKTDLQIQPDGHCGRQLDSLVRSFASRSTLKKDVERLIKVRGPAACR